MEGRLRKTLGYLVQIILTQHRPSLAHSYVYTFEPNQDWSSFYAPASEIQQYLQKVSDKYSAHRFIKLSHKVTGCYWDAEKLKWFGYMEIE